MASKTRPLSISRENNAKKPVTTRLPVSDLLLDCQNPRFASDRSSVTQEDLVRTLWNEFAVDEVALSIAANGFFAEEPLFVIPSETEKVGRAGQYIVIEGNRRLAAVLILRDGTLRNKIKALNLPEIDKDASDKLATLPVSIYDNRAELWKYLGFRHINGPQPWDSLSKAMYVAAVHDQQRISLEEIATSIGDRHSTVARLYRGYKILQQAESMTPFRREDRVSSRFYFSHLYTATDQMEFQKFLGIKSEESLKPDPVPKKKLKELAELVLWLYGRKADKIAPVVERQNPDLNILREVISAPKGLAALRAGLPLKRSHEISIGDKQRLLNAMIRAKEELQIADGTISTGYDGEDNVNNIMTDIKKIVTSLSDRITSKRNQ